MRAPEQLPFDPEKFPSEDNGITRCLLNLAFKIEKYERLVAVAPQFVDALRRLKELKAHVSSLEEEYYDLRNQARSFYNAYLTLSNEPSEYDSTLSDAHMNAVELLMRDPFSESFSSFDNLLPLLRRAAFRKEIASLAIESISNAVDHFEKDVSEEALQKAAHDLSWYKSVAETGEEERSEIAVTYQATYFEIIRRILDNPRINRVIVAGPPSSGKSKAITALISLLHHEDIGAIEKSFDRHFQATMRFFKIPSSEWSLFHTQQFDRMLLNSLIMMAAHYPMVYKAEKIRQVDVIDALGYPVNLDEPWHMLIDSTGKINNGECIVWYIVAEDAIIQEGIKNRDPGVINPHNQDEIAKNLQKGGAPAGTIIAHINKLRALISRIARNNSNLRKKIRSVNVQSDQFQAYDKPMKKDLAHRIAYAFWLRDSLGINPSQWFVSVNFHNKSNNR